MALCLTPLAAQAAPEAARMREVVDAAVLPIVAEHKRPGLAVAITVDGSAYVFNYGVASRATNRPVNEATLFELGSVGKTFAATLALYAQALGKLSLADRRGEPAEPGHLHRGRFAAAVSGRGR